MRRLVLLCTLGLAAMATASCSSGTTAPPHVTATTAPVASPTTTTPATTTTVPAPGHVGTTQVAVGPGGQKVSALAGNPGHQGYEVGGPLGSWYMGVIVTNEGPGVFQTEPASQLAIVDTAGKSYAPQEKTTTSTGKPTALPVGQEARMILIVVLPSGATPAAITFAPFGPSGTTLRWTI